MDPASNWRAKVAARPWPAVGLAAAAGALAGVLLPRRPGLPWRAKLGDAVLATLAAIAMRAVRDAAARRLGAIAMTWWDEAQARARRDRDAPHVS